MPKTMTIKEDVKHTVILFAVFLAMTAVVSDLLPWLAKIVEHAWK